MINAHNHRAEPGIGLEVACNKVNGVFELRGEVVLGVLVRNTPVRKFLHDAFATNYEDHLRLGIELGLGQGGDVGCGRGGSGVYDLRADSHAHLLQLVAHVESTLETAVSAEEDAFAASDEFI